MVNYQKNLVQLFHDRGLYHIETSLLIFITNQCNGFYVIGTSVMKDLMMEKENQNWALKLLRRISGKMVKKIVKED